MKQDVVTLYHSGFQQIRKPDIHYGRKNADFGQGFYLSDNEEFSRRWAKRRRGETTYINIYRLDLSDRQHDRMGIDENVILHSTLS